MGLLTFHAAVNYSLPFNGDTMENENKNYISNLQTYGLSLKLNLVREFRN